MSVGILLITHSGVGQALIATVKSTFEHTPLSVLDLSVDKDPDPDLVFTKASMLVSTLDDGHGVLVLTDMFGATPSNIALRLKDHHQVRVIAGLNLPMLFKIMNYPDLSLKDLATKAIQGGKEGIFESKLETLEGHDQVALKKQNHQADPAFKQTKKL